MWSPDQQHQHHLAIQILGLLRREPPSPPNQKPSGGPDGHSYLRATGLGVEDGGEVRACFTVEIIPEMCLEGWVRLWGEGTFQMEQRQGEVEAGGLCRGNGAIRFTQRVGYLLEEEWEKKVSTDTQWEVRMKPKMFCCEGFESQDEFMPNGETWQEFQDSYYRMMHPCVICVRDTQIG